VTEIENSYSEWLAQSSVPKLFGRGDPGGMAGSLVDFVRTWNAQREVTVRGLHFLQEDSPTRLGGQSPTGWRR
jgi:haloalkane dehalogenase